MLRSVFMHDSYLQYIAMIKSLVEYNVLVPGQPRSEASFRRIQVVERGMSGERIPSLNIAERNDVCLNLRIRRAVEEDNDDILPIIERHSKRLREIYGDFYISELVSRHPESERVILVCEEEQEQDSIPPKSREKELSSRFSHLSDKAQLNIMELLEEDEEELEFDIVNIDTHLLKVPSLISYEEFTKTQLGATDNVSRILDGRRKDSFEDKSLKKERIKKSLAAITTLPHHKVQEPTRYSGEPNAFLIEIFAMHQDYDERIGSSRKSKTKILLEALKRSCDEPSSTDDDSSPVHKKRNLNENDRTVEVEIHDSIWNCSEEVAAYENMGNIANDEENVEKNAVANELDFYLKTLVTPYIPRSRFVNESLFVSHINSVKGEVHVRPAEEYDVPYFADVLVHAPRKNELLELIDSSFTFDELDSYVLLSRNQPVGVVVVAPLEDALSVRLQYSLEPEPCIPDTDGNSPSRNLMSLTSHMVPVAANLSTPIISRNKEKENVHKERPTSPYLTFTNLTLVSEHGLPTVAECLRAADTCFPRDGRYTDRYLKCVPYYFYIDVVSAVMVRIDRKKKCIHLKGGSVKYYDDLVLTCGQQFQHPEYLNQLLERDRVTKTKNACNRVPMDNPKYRPDSVPPPPNVPDNIMLINSLYDANACLRKLLRMITESKESINSLSVSRKIIVYGDCIDAYSCIAALLELGIAANMIVFVEPFPPEDTAALRVNCFNNELVDERVQLSLDKRGIQVYRQCYFTEWVLSGPRVDILRFMTPTQVINISCFAFFYYGIKAIDVNSLKAITDSGLVYDGGLIVGPSFESNDPSVYGAGPCTSYSRRLHASTFAHRHYCSEDVGEAGHILQTDKDGNYFRLQLNTLHCVMSLTCLSKKPFSSENIVQIYGKHEAFFDKLLVRYQIDDLYDFFAQTWMSAMYHMSFEDLLYDIDHQDVGTVSTCDLKKKVAVIQLG
ncbi:unnamed protein product [Parnassius apollo]|uniref:(apollo) hypothetical protein n=1 Tax=Parnassius apollo TaxID=110799 RepID=A0A8S3X2M8_PARAO|nr:unnamed protein product [Parnassius apollo]